MTRKRYIKLLMSLDVPRDQANAWAWFARQTGTPYAEDYKARRPWLQMQQNMRMIKRAMGRLGAAITSAAARITAALAVTSTYRLDPADYEYKPEPPELWPKENPHRIDAVDAMTYAAQYYQTLLHPLPDNMQVMSRADHDTLHGMARGIDLAAGPDFTGYKPVMRLDSMVINAEPVLPVRKMAAHELAAQIEEALRK